MSYTINLTNGNLFATIADGTINTTATVGGTVPLTLIGKNYAGYGQFLDDNFIHLLENGASSTQPSAPLTGQLWYNTTSGILQVYNGTGFKSLGGATSSSTAPTNNNIGDFWWDTTNAQLNVYSGSSWVLIGPAYSSSIGLTGAIAANVVDTSGLGHPVVELFCGATLVGIISRDATFTPTGTGLTGFPTISPGIQLATNSAVPGALFQGTATNSQQLDGITANLFMRTDIATSTSGTLTVNNGGTAAANIAINNGGSNGVGNIGTSTSYFNTVFANRFAGNATTAITVTANAQPNITSVGTLTSLSVSGNINAGNISGTATTAINVTANAQPNITSTGILSSLSLSGGIVNAAGNGVSNIGSSSAYFNTIFAQATSAQYADLAERFAADIEYEAGTVVELGGSAEITKVTAELSDSVFGVISTRAAYLMNGGAGTDATHPPVAMTGRVPVKVVGTINKGDRLVSAGNGIARAAQPGEATAFNVIGRALVGKSDTGLGTVEAIVTIK